MLNLYCSSFLNVLIYHFCMIILCEWSDVIVFCKLGLFIFITIILLRLTTCKFVFKDRYIHVYYALFFFVVYQMGSVNTIYMLYYSVLHVHVFLPVFWMNPFFMFQAFAKLRCQKYVNFFFFFTIYFIDNQHFQWIVNKKSLAQY